MKKMLLLTIAFFAGLAFGQQPVQRTQGPLSPPSTPSSLSPLSPPSSPRHSPSLEFVMQLRVTLGETYTLGTTPQGRRTVVPITGGTFAGERLRGTILGGGADYQLTNGPRTTLEAIYTIRTDDGTYIHVRNRGIIANGTAADGQPTVYFKAAPQFEAPTDGPYSWLNDALFVCEPDFSEHFAGIVLNVWMVK